MMQSITIFHVFALCESIFAIYTYHVYVAPFRKDTYGGHWKFLTYINLNIQLVCFSLCILCDILQYLKYHNYARARQFKDFFYASLGVPSCLSVFVSFWTLFFIDRELVYPKALDEYLPIWANHIWHTAIIITLIEVICDHHEYPRKSLGLSVCSIFGIGYIVWVEWVQKQGNITVYPILKQLQGVWYYMFITVEIFFSWLTYLFGEFLNAKVGVTQGSQKFQKVKRSKKQK